MNNNFNYVYPKLKKMCRCVNKNVPLADMSSFKIGGKAKLVAEPESLEEIIKVVGFLSEKQIKHYVVGNCTNLLFCDDVFEGVVVKISNRFNQVEFFGKSVVAYAGASLSGLCVATTEKGLSGMEDAFGIPGTVGGAVVMNAGAYGFKMSDVVADVLALVDGKIKLFTNADCKFGYRQSVFKNSGAIILRVQFSLDCSKKAELIERREEVKAKRLVSQPITQHSAGSVFKNPDGLSVAKLIDESGLKGYAFGGAMVSEKHANFIVNAGGAKAKDVLMLIEIIKTTIKKDYNLDLETEIIYVN